MMPRLHSRATTSAVGFLRLRRIPIRPNPRSARIRDSPRPMLVRETDDGDKRRRSYAKRHTTAALALVLLQPEQVSHGLNVGLARPLLEPHCGVVEQLTNESTGKVFHNPSVLGLEPGELT